MKANTQSMTKRASFRVLRTFYVLDGLFKAVRARLRGRVFVCTDLANWHDLQNLMINSDGTITCDCGDVTGEGQLGNLLTEPLEVIYQGAKASAFRQKLREGKLPMIRCIMCPALKETLPGQQPAGSPAPGVKPRICSLSIETTVLCNYNCLGCMRDIIYSHRQKQDLTREELKTVLQRFDGYEISRLFLYNRGEPTLAKDFATELRTIKECFPGTPIYFSTNGSFLDNPHTANAILDYATGVQVSIDGPDQRTAERYQLGIDFSRVLHNLTELVSLRDKLDRDKPAIFWKYVLFWWNDRREQLEKTIALAKAAGVDGILFFPAKNPFWGMPLHFHLSVRRYRREWGLTRAVTGEILLQFKAELAHHYGGFALS
ncbi:MAG: radical SAM protein [Limisphaerales bacterium]